MPGRIISNYDLYSGTFRNIQLDDVDNRDSGGNEGGGGNSSAPASSARTRAVRDPHHLPTGHYTAGDPPAGTYPDPNAGIHLTDPAGNGCLSIGGVGYTQAGCGGGTGGGGGTGSNGGDAPPPTPPPAGTPNPPADPLQTIADAISGILNQPMSIPSAGQPSVVPGGDAAGASNSSAIIIIVGIAVFGYVAYKKLHHHTGGAPA